jgi:hypothetical protein
MDISRRSFLQHSVALAATPSLLSATLDAIVRTAVDHKLKVIELRSVCTRPEDYANPIEPSSIGAAKIARAIAAVVRGPVEGKGAVLIGGA